MKAALAVMLCLIAAFPASSASVHCISASIPKGEAAQHDGGRWIELTKEQWLFLAGIYAMNPQTPAGLPFGDKAAMVTVPENDGALVFFLDGDLACTPMPVPHELIEMLHDVATGAVKHGGGT